MEEKELTEKEIFLSCCGVDAFGNNKSIVSLKLSMIDMNTGTEEIQDEMLIDNPIVNILRNPRFTMVDLTFPIKDDYEFINTAARLQDFSKVENTAENKEGTVGPTIVLTVTPKEHRGAYFASGMHGVWCLMPSMVGKVIDTIRFIFDNELFGAYTNDLSSIDMSEIEEKIYEEELSGGQ